MKTTLNKIRKHEPCTSGWEKLLTYLGKTKADDEPISIATILDSNGLDDALWCLRAVDGYDKEIRLFAVWCAGQVQHLMKDQRSIDALDVAERYANGEATEEELEVARAAARSATAYADAAAWSTAGTAATAAYAATYAAAWSAAYTADAAARSATAYADAAARSATAYADAAAWSAAGTAADAAWDAAEAAYAAGHEMKKKQEAELRRICGEECNGD